MFYLPVFKGPVEGFIVNFINKNHWRVARIHDREDLMQDAHIVFLRVQLRYQVETPQHFMALFVRTWLNHFTDLSRDDTASRIMVQHDYVGEVGEGYQSSWDVSGSTVGDTNNDGYLATLIAQAPREVSMVLNLFLNAPQEILDVALSSWQGRDKRFKAGGSKKICKLLGLEPGLDVLKAVEEYFATA